MKEAVLRLYAPDRHPEPDAGELGGAPEEAVAAFICKDTLQY
jgi:hypothetical protein